MKANGAPKKERRGYRECVRTILNDHPRLIVGRIRKGGKQRARYGPTQVRGHT